MSPLAVLMNETMKKVEKIMDRANFNSFNCIECEENINYYELYHSTYDGPVCTQCKKDKDARLTI